MVRPIRNEPAMPPKNVKPVEKSASVSPSLQKEKETIAKLTKGKLGAGSVPQFSKKAPPEHKVVTQATKGRFPISSKEI